MHRAFFILVRQNAGLLRWKSETGKKDGTKHLPLSLKNASPPGAAEMAMLDDDVRFRLINQRYPHIGKRLRELWETEEFGDYIDQLLGDTRGGTRARKPDPDFSCGGPRRERKLQDRGPTIPAYREEAGRAMEFPRLFGVYQRPVPGHPWRNATGLPERRVGRAFQADAGPRPAISGCSIRSTGHLEPEQ